MISDNQLPEFNSQDELTDYIVHYRETFEAGKVCRVMFQGRAINIAAKFVPVVDNPNATDVIVEEVTLHKEIN